MKITALKFGESVFGENHFFPGGSREKQRPISFIFYLLQHDNRNILVDTGCTTMPGWEMKNFCGPVPALARAGLTPADITDVLITHAHHDHIESAGFYTNAAFYLQKDEYEKGKKYLPQGAKLFLFEKEISPLPGLRMVCIGGHSAGSCVVEIGDCVIVGDECYSLENLEKKIPTGSSVDPAKSRAFIETYSDPRWHALLCHEE